MTRRCSRCVTPDNWPGIRFDSEGVCSLCRSWEKNWGTWSTDENRRRDAFEQLMKTVHWAPTRKKGRFDVLVPISGGKDSLYVLYWLKNNTNLSILTYTYDNGLFHPGARENIRIATTALGVEHRWDQLPFQQELLRHHLQKTGNFCGACVIPYLIGSHRCARDNGIPLIAFGLSKRSDANPPDGMNPFYFRNVVNDGFGMERFHPIWGKFPEVDYVSDSLLGRLRVINLPDHLDWDDIAITNVLVKELGVELGREHFDCVGHEVSDWLMIARYGFGYATLKASQLIRAGQLTREEGLAMVEQHSPDRLPDSAAILGERLGLDPSQIEQASRKSMKPYFKGLFCFLAVQHRKIFFGR